MRAPLAFTAFVLSLCLAGCALDPLDYHANTDRDYEGPSADTKVARGEDFSVQPLTSAIALMPSEAGRVIQVNQREFTDGIQQEIVLTADASARGENRIDVLLRTSPENDSQYDNLIKMKRPTDADVAREMEERFPGMRMDIAAVLLQNSHGPYGIASGRRGAELCIYAWQWIDDINGNGNSGRRSIVRGVTPASIRVRLCRSNATFEQLAAYVNQLTVAMPVKTPMTPLQAYNAPRTPLGTVAGGYAGSVGTGDALGVVSGPTVASRTRAFDGYSVAAPPHYARAAQVRTRVARRATPRRRIVRRQVKPDQSEAQAQTYAPYTAGQPQIAPAMQPSQAWSYPGTAAPAQPAYGAQQTNPYAYQAAPAQQGPRGLDQSLPAQAYRGPSAPSQPAAARVAPAVGTGAATNAYQRSSIGGVYQNQ